MHGELANARATGSRADSSPENRPVGTVILLFNLTPPGSFRRPLSRGHRKACNFSLSNRLTNFGLALPRVAFIICPISQRATASLPARYC
jgi:hypothetical protein